MAALICGWLWPWILVQIDELPSMYSRPFESRSRAPFPSTRMSGSCSGAHHSRIFVNGCQTHSLSAAISSSLFQSLITLSLADYLLDRGKVLRGSAPTLVFSKNDV